MGVWCGRRALVVEGLRADGVVVVEVERSRRRSAVGRSRRRCNQVVERSVVVLVKVVEMVEKETAEVMVVIGLVVVGGGLGLAA